MDLDFDQSRIGGVPSQEGVACIEPSDGEVADIAVHNQIGTGGTSYPERSGFTQGGTVLACCQQRIERIQRQNNYVPILLEQFA